MSAEAARILVVEDDRSVADLVSMALEAKGYHVLVARDGLWGLRLFKREKPDLVLLDLMMPGLDGMKVAQFMRSASQVPIIVLSAIGQEDTKVQALEMGADDYLTKPFGAKELVARVRAALRRANGSNERGASPPLELGDLRVDHARRRVIVAGTEVPTTPIEYRLLSELLRGANRVVTHGELLERVWGPAYRDSTNYLHVYIGRLRRKLAKARDLEIATEPGVGYMLRAT